MSNEPMDVDSVLNALESPYRRQLLVALSNHNPQDDDCDPLNLLSVTEEAAVLESALVDSHLPKLDEMGYISWDQTTNEISKGPDWDEIAPVLKVMVKHKNDLPDGWV